MVSGARAVTMPGSTLVAPVTMIRPGTRPPPVVILAIPFFHKQMKCQQEAQKLKIKGNQSLEKCHFLKAYQFYSAALALQPNNHIYLSNRALSLLKMNRWKQAKSDAQLAVSINPNYSKGYHRLCSSLIQLNHLEEASKVLEQGLEKCQKDEVLQQIEQILRDQLKKKIPACQSPSIVSLLAWLREQCKFQKVKICQPVQGYRSAVATQKILAGEKVLFIPLKYLITLQKAKNDPIVKKLIASGADLLSPKHSYLTVCLLKERSDPASPWKPYIDVLPKDISNFPTTFSNQLLQQLNGSQFKNQVIVKKDDILKDYKLICETSPEFQAYPFQQFLWGRMMACSRIFGLTINGTKTDAFVPLADLLNHRTPRQTSWRYSEQEGGFVVQALEAIQRQKQIYDSYGKKCSSRFFINYGFIFQNNQANELEFRVYYGSKDPLLQVKQNILSEKGTHKHYRLTIDHNQNAFLQLLFAIRVVLSSSQIQLLHPYKLMQPLSVKRQNQVWTYLKNYLLKRVNSYPTTLQEDKCLLQKELQFNLRNCILFRAEQKKILKHYLNLSLQVQGLFMRKQKQIRKLLNSGEMQEFSVFILNNLASVLNKIL